MATQEDNFFATQIAQKQDINNHQSNQAGQQNKTIEQRKEQAYKNQKNSLKQLLSAFNIFDHRGRGVISLGEMQNILKSYQLPVQQTSFYYKMSLPIFADSVTFDEFLFIFGLCETQSSSVDQQVQFAKNVDAKLIDFLKLLNNYRKKMQKAGSYKDAKKSKSKIQQIRQRQLMRRKNYLNMLHEKQVIELESKQKDKFIQFCSTWDQFMIDYQNSGIQLIDSMKNKHEAECSEFIYKNRVQLGNKHHPSKQLLELINRQKNFVRIQDYSKAQKTRQEISEMRQQQQIKKRQQDQTILQMRLSHLKKKQAAELNTLLQKIQKDRNQQIKQRQGDSQKLIIRNKTLLTEINHRHTENIKNIYDALHNLSLDMTNYQTLKSSA